MINSKQETTHILREKQIMHLLNQSNNPFVPTLFGTNQTDTELMFLIEFVRGCDLLSVLSTVKSFYHFYGAEVISCLIILHQQSIIYRDLKPEHVIIDQSGHIKLVDFGFAKQISSKTTTNCGTLVYVAPEVLKQTGTSFEADVWSLGVLIHEMICGQTPFNTEDTMNQYDAIVKCRPVYSSLLGAQLRELLEKIFVPDPQFRISLLQI